MINPLPDQGYEVICFSHLRWNFVYQRPQHLLSRFAMMTRVFYIEEPVYDSEYHFNEIRRDIDTKVFVVIPHLGMNLSTEQAIESQRILVDGLIRVMKITDYITWYYSPMFYPFSDHLKPLAKVFDCMDELSAFKFAPTDLLANEARLMEDATIVFTGGRSLYEAKKHRHSNIHSFPSSIDKAHFRMARSGTIEPKDSANIGHPKIGYYGVIDERLDLTLIDEIAAKKPEWNFIYIGPVVKIDPETLPKRENIFYLGSKTYADLPQYLATWDIAMMPFALDESTRFISPTKTPEYLAGGKPVISTAIDDVIATYGSENLVHIIHNSDEFIEAAALELQQHDKSEWLEKVDECLASISWNDTWSDMKTLIEHTIESKKINKENNTQAYV